MRRSRKRQSLADPTIYKGPPRGMKPTSPDPDQGRSKSAGSGRQGLGICPACGATCTLKKLAEYDDLRKLNFELGTPVIGRHRVGGGKCHLMRGDVPCKGVGQLPESMV